MLMVRKREIPVQKPEVFEQAIEAFQNQDYFLCENLCRKILRGEEWHLGATMLLAKCHFARCFYREAQLLLLRLKEQDPDNQDAAAMLKQIDTHYLMPMMHPPLKHTTNPYINETNKPENLELPPIPEIITEKSDLLRPVFRAVTPEEAKKHQLGNKDETLMSFRLTPVGQETDYNQAPPSQNSFNQSTPTQNLSSQNPQPPTPQTQLHQTQPPQTQPPQNPLPWMKGIAGASAISPMTPASSATTNAPVFNQAEPMNNPFTQPQNNPFAQPQNNPFVPPKPQATMPPESAKVEINPQQQNPTHPAPPPSVAMPATPIMPEALQDVANNPWNLPFQTPAAETTDTVTTPAPASLSPSPFDAPPVVAPAPLPPAAAPSSFAPPPAAAIPDAPMPTNLAPATPTGGIARPAPSPYGQKSKPIWQRGQAGTTSPFPNHQTVGFDKSKHNMNNLS